MYNVNSNTILSNCLFAGNIAMGYDSEYYGGGICDKNSSTKLTNCLFVSNLADWGGAISNDANSSMTLEGCTFSGNYANDVGGAISSTSDGVNIVNCTFEDNAAWSYGGGISCSGNIVLTNCIFTRNSAPIGGGIYTWFPAGALLKKCTFTGNTAGYGGGAYIGGAWLDDPNSSTLLIDCTFSGNSAYGGGGIYCARNTKTAVMKCAFAGNRATSTGGGIYYCGCEQKLTNCIFTGNLAQGGNALSFQTLGLTQPSNVQAVNCILWDGSRSVLNSDGSTVVITYSSVQCGWPGEGNIDDDPCFANPGYWADPNDPNIPGDPNDPNAVWIEGDYHLKSQAGRWDPKTKTWIKDDVTSLCIDAGDPMSPIIYESFPNGGRINMGAYGGTVEASKSYFGEPVCEEIVAGDINGDCKVDFADFQIMSLHWLKDIGS
jgi:predicted outer membrane repeat protein